MTPKNDQQQKKYQYFNAQVKSDLQSVSMKAALFKIFQYEHKKVTL